MGLFDHIDQKLSFTIAVVALSAAFCLFLLLCILSAYLCWRRKSLGPTANDDPSCRNDGFDITDEITPSRIEQRQQRRHEELTSTDPWADVHRTETFDRSVGNALAVEQLYCSTYVFNTNILPRPEGDVQVIAAKRDYL